jgi:hypothetical protein
MRSLEDEACESRFCVGQVISGWCMRLTNFLSKIDASIVGSFDLFHSLLCLKYKYNQFSTHVES